MLGIRGKIIASIAHFLVVERSYFLQNIIILCAKISFAANYLRPYNSFELYGRRLSCN